MGGWLDCLGVSRFGRNISDIDQLSYQNYLSRLRDGQNENPTRRALNSEIYTRKLIPTYAGFILQVEMTQVEPKRELRSRGKVIANVQQNVYQLIS